MTKLIIYFIIGIALTIYANIIFKRYENSTYTETPTWVNNLDIDISNFASKASFSFVTILMWPIILFLMLLAWVIDINR